MPDREKVIKGLQIERECVSRDCDRDCGKCDLVQDRDWLLSVYDDAITLLKEQDKLVNVDKLREELGFAESCEKCKKDSWRCQRDTYFTEMDFCNRLDFAIEELTQEGR